MTQAQRNIKRISRILNYVKETINIVKTYRHFGICRWITDKLM